MLREQRVHARSVLVVGCGDGTEAEHVARHGTFERVIGIDRNPELRARPGVPVVLADARHLPIRDQGVDALYCYHVLEHVPRPEQAVDEASRVLARDGLAFVGTPNRSRIVGYVGGREGLLNKVRQNLGDWIMRIRGRWSNAQGAHAGFTTDELASLLSRTFPFVRSRARSYYEAKYPRHPGLWRFAFASRLARVATPSVYFLAGFSPLRDEQAGRYSETPAPR